MNSTLTDANLYFGTVPVYFKIVPGTSVGVIAQTLTETTEEQYKAASLQRADTAAYLGPEYAQCVVPAIPATDLKVDLTGSSAAVQSWPAFLQQPLLKVPATAAYDFKGVASGVRSALIQDPSSGRWYRLKGCGNNAEGFIFAPISKKPTEVLTNIRGCCFEWTAQRELFMINLVATSGVVSANKALGYYVYEDAEYKLPKIQRCCVVAEAFGERRLSDHVLTGLELVLDLLVAATPAKQLELKNITALFPDIRLAVDDPTSAVMPTWLAVTIGMAPPYADLLAERKDPLKLSNVVDSKAELGNEAWRELWMEAAKIIQDSSVDILSLFAQLYWQFGREVGATMRVLQANRISWGTYKDKLGMHCNAHTNNFVLLPENHAQVVTAETDDRQPTPYLGMLDLDMAFTKTSHVFANDAKFEEWLQLEAVMMRQALSGDPECSTGLDSSTKPLSKTANTLQWALRDTMMKAYASALAAEEDLHPVDPTWSTASYALLRLALICTVDKIA